jgi:hypothetical protein
MEDLMPRLGHKYVIDEKAPGVLPLMQLNEAGAAASGKEAAQ